MMPCINAQFSCVCACRIVTVMQPIQRTVVVAALATVATLAAAAPAAAAPDRLAADVELDPTAYALGGHSLHAGIARGHWRLDLGNFAMDLPAFAHADDGVAVSFAGFGAKLQYFARATRRGWFAGVDAGLIEVQARHAGAVTDQRQLGLGVHGGYRVALPADLYATVWLGVGYAAGAAPMHVGGATYEPSPITVFPALHLGRTF